jgi:chloramphenicol 3-O-phosphotransferase
VSTANSASEVTPGRIVVLNGPALRHAQHRRRLQETFDGPWLNLGVDVFSQLVTATAFRRLAEGLAAS